MKARPRTAKLVGAGESAGLFWTLIVLDDQYIAYGLATTGVVALPAAVALNQWLWVPP